jgi:hypothetical protein
MKLLLFEQICKTKSKTGAIITERKTLKNGHMYVTRETKTGVAAKKELQKFAKLQEILKTIGKEIL